MGIFSFLKDIGKKVGIGNEADDIKEDITEALGDQVEDLGVAFDDGVVTLRGTVASQATREKAVLLAGNVKGVERVTDNLRLKLTADGPSFPDRPTPLAPVDEPPAPVFYTVQPGDSLSKIAKAHYGNAMKWPALFEANREVIKDADLIYPGQQIRIPELDA